MKLTLRHRQPEIAFRLTCDCPGAVAGDWLFADPSVGTMRIVTDAVVQQHYVVGRGGRGHRPGALVRTPQ